METPRIVGATVKRVRRATKAELDSQYFGPERWLVVELDNGIKLAALRDEEGNGTGCLISLYGKDSFYVQDEK